MTDSDDIVKEFLVESYENLDRLDRDLIELEKHPSDREVLASIFRTIHTIKGTSGFLAFSKLEAVTHVGENLLTRLRDGQLQLNPEIATALLAMVDAVRQMLMRIETQGNEGEEDHGELIANLTRLLQPGPEGKSVVQTPKRTAGATGQPLQEREHPPAVEEGAASSVVQTEAAAAGGLSPAPAQKTPEAAAVEAKAGIAAGPSASDSTIRVDVSLLDQLMNLVGELVLARNQILQFTNSTEESGLVATSQRLNLITSELQEGVMKTRMQPIGNIWSKFPRTVRDVAMSCGKRVRIEMSGKETELDKTLIEAIKDPLTHLVRNAVDHGIERPEVRQAAGKDAEGRLFLHAFHEGGQVNIEISDDGAGLNLEKIRNKAIQKGLITADQATRMSEREIVNLIFLPGFSTAEKVTNVSGRGVGLDVVKTHIEKIGGAVDVQSRQGQGVMVRMKIPLTLAIIPALIVTSRGERYAIPQVSLLELVRLEGEHARAGIEMIHGAPVYRLRGHLLPLVYLRRALGEDVGEGPEETTSDTPDASASSATGSRCVNIVVLQAEGQQFGLVVDEVNDTEEIVVKPLSKQLKAIAVYAGATIMGDGKVALILDVLGLAHSSSILAEGKEGALAEAEAAQVASAGQKQKLVLFTGPCDSRMAVPLNMLARLENIPGAEVERSGNQWVTQYRGQILPLIRVSHALEERRQVRTITGVIDLPTAATLQVLVLEHERQAFGLVVNQILDIVESALEPQSPPTRAGVLFSSVVSERVTEMLDVPAILRGGEAFAPVAAVQG